MDFRSRWPKQIPVDLDLRNSLITSVTGQNVAYLSEFFLANVYEAHGIKSRASLFNTQRINHVYFDQHDTNPKLKLHYGDLSDALILTRILIEIEPEEVYNLGAQSHVAVSLETPKYTADVDGIGTLRLLETNSFLELEKKTRFYQASTSELYGLVQETPRRETTPFQPRSTYAVANLYAYWITVNYPGAYAMHASNGKLVNHESPRRGETFVTHKITRCLENNALCIEDCRHMGDFDVLRDWGHAKDYVRTQWVTLQQDQPEDFVIAIGMQYSVRQFVAWAADVLGVEVGFQSKGLNEKGVATNVRGNIAPAMSEVQVIVKIDPHYFHLAEIDPPIGDTTKAREKLGWSAKITAQKMCTEMAAGDLKAAKHYTLLRKHGLDLSVSIEN